MKQVTDNGRAWRWCTTGLRSMRKLLRLEIGKLSSEKAEKSKDG